MGDYMKDYLEKILCQNVVINEAEYKKMLFKKNPELDILKRFSEICF